MGTRSTLGYAAIFVLSTSLLLGLSYGFYGLLLRARFDLSGAFVQGSVLALLAFLLLLIARYFGLLWFSYLAHLEEQLSGDRDNRFTPLIMALVPAYNERDYIEQTIQRLQNHTLLPEEIIVIDDCSSDATGKVAEEMGVTL